MPLVGVEWRRVGLPCDVLVSALLLCSFFPLLFVMLEVDGTGAGIECVHVAGA